METHIQTPKNLKILLWIDAVTAIVTGIVVLAFLSVIANATSLPAKLLITMSVFPFFYAIFAFYLLGRKGTSIPALKIFIYANWAWVFGCLVLLLFLFSQTNILGISYFFIQAVFVTILTLLERKQLKSL